MHAFCTLHSWAKHPFLRSTVNNFIFLKEGPEEKHKDKDYLHCRASAKNGTSTRGAPHIFSSFTSEQIVAKLLGLYEKRIRLFVRTLSILPPHLQTEIVHIHPYLFY